MFSACTTSVKQESFTPLAGVKASGFTPRLRVKPEGFTCATGVKLSGFTPSLEVKPKGFTFSK